MKEKIDKRVSDAFFDLWVKIGGQLDKRVYHRICIDGVDEGAIGVRYYEFTRDTNLADCLSLSRGDKAVDIGMVGSDNKYSLKNITMDLNFVAYTMKIEEWDPKFVYGRTNQYVGRIAKRYGFNTQQVESFDYLSNLKVESNYFSSAAARRAREKGEKVEINKIFCYMNGEEFFERFLNPNMLKSYLDPRPQYKI